MSGTSSGFVRGRNAVHLSQVGSDLGPIAVAMAGVAGQNAAPAKVTLIDSLHHQNHLPRCLFFRGVVRVMVPVGAACLTMAVHAVVV